MTSDKFITELEESHRTGEDVEFIRDREDELKVDTKPISFAAGQFVTYKFIHPETVVIARAFSKGFHLNDGKANDMFATAILEVVRADGDESPDSLVVIAAQLAVLRYMGVPRPNLDKQRKKLLGGLIRGQRRSISEMADSGVSMCVERASVTHNMCLIAGVPSILVSGKARADGEKKGQGHVFQLVRNDSTNSLFDSTNPSFDLRDASPNVIPTLEPISALEFLLGIQGKKLDITYRTNEETQQQTLQYTHQPTFPSTYEGFDALNFSQRAALSEVREHHYKKLALEDCINKFLESELAVDYLTN